MSSSFWWNSQRSQCERLHFHHQPATHSSHRYGPNLKVGLGIANCKKTNTRALKHNKTFLVENLRPLSAGGKKTQWHNTWNCRTVDRNFVNEVHHTRFFFSAYLMSLKSWKAVHRSDFLFAFSFLFFVLMILIFTVDRLFLMCLNFLYCSSSFLYKAHWVAFMHEMCYINEDALPYILCIK